MKILISKIDAVDLALIVLIIIGLIVISSLVKDNKELLVEINYTEGLYNEINSSYDNLKMDYEGLQKEYQGLSEEYEHVIERERSLQKFSLNEEE